MSKGKEIASMQERMPEYKTNFTYVSIMTMSDDVMLNILRSHAVPPKEGIARYNREQTMAKSGKVLKDEYLWIFSSKSACFALEELLVNDAKTRYSTLDRDIGVLQEHRSYYERLDEEPEVKDTVIIDEDSKAIDDLFNPTPRVKGNANMKAKRKNFHTTFADPTNPDAPKINASRLARTADRRMGRRRADKAHHKQLTQSMNREEHSFVHHFDIEEVKIHRPEPIPVVETPEGVVAIEIKVDRMDTDLSRFDQGFPQSLVEAKIDYIQHLLDSHESEEDQKMFEVIRFNRRQMYLTRAAHPDSKVQLKTQAGKILNVNFVRAQKFVDEIEEKIRYKLSKRIVLRGGMNAAPSSPDESFTAGYFGVTTVLTVGTAKKILAEIYVKDPDEWMPMYHGRLLVEERTLYYYGISNIYDIELVPKLRGGVLVWKHTDASKSQSAELIRDIELSHRDSDQTSSLLLSEFQHIIAYIFRQSNVYIYYDGMMLIDEQSSMCLECGLGPHEDYDYDLFTVAFTHPKMGTRARVDVAKYVHSKMCGCDPDEVFLLYNGKPIGNGKEFLDDNTILSDYVTSADQITYCHKALGGMDAFNGVFDDVKFDFNSFDIDFKEIDLNPLKMIETKFGSEVSSYIKMAMSFCCFGYQMYRSRNKMDYAAAVLQFTMAFDFDASVPLIADNLQHLQHLIIRGDVLETEYKTEGFASDLLGSVIDSRNFMGSVFSSQFATCVKQLILAIAASKVLPKELVKRAYDVIGKPAVKMGYLQIVDSALDSVVLMYQMAVGYANGEPMTEILLSKSPFDAFFATAKQLIDMQDKTYLGLPPADVLVERWERRDYRISLGKALEAGESLRLNSSFCDSIRRTKLEKVLRELQDIAFQIDLTMRTAKRLAPNAIVLSGDPSIGKSNLIEWLLRCHASVKGRDFTQDMCYPRSKTSQYWEGYSSLHHPYIHYSEMGNESNAMADKMMSEVFIEMNSLIDSLPFQCDMAFGDKGKVYASPELVVIDTNNRLMHIKKWAYCPSAYLRRFLFCDVAVLPEFRSMKGNSSSLDKALSFAAYEDGSNLLDRYSFSFSTYYAKGKNGVEEQLASGLRLMEATEFLKNYLANDIYMNERVQAAIDYSFIDEVDIKRDERGLKPIGGSDDVFFAETQHIKMSSIGKMSILPMSAMRALQEENSHREENKNDPSTYDDAADDYLGSYYGEAGDEKKEYQTQGLNNFASEITSIFDRFSKDPSDYVTNHFWKERLFYTMIFCLASVYLYAYDSKLTKWCKMFTLSVVSYLLVFYFPPSVTFCIFMIYITFPILKFGILPKTMLKMSHKSFRSSVLSSWERAKKKITARAKEFNNPYTWCALGVAVTAIYGAKRLLRKYHEHRIATEGLATSFMLASSYNDDLRDIEEKSDIKPKQIRNKREISPHWTVLDKSTRSSVFNGLSEELSAVVAGNQRLCTVYTANTSITTYMLGVQGSYAIMNAHPFAGCDVVKIDLYQKSVTLDDMKEHTPQIIGIPKSRITQICDDILMVDVGSTIFKALDQHFIRGRFPELVTGEVQGRRVAGTLRRNMVAQDHNLGNICLAATYHYEMKHEGGMCGLAFVADVDVGGAAILGLHTAGALRSLDSFAAVVTHDQVLSGIKILKDTSKLMPLHSEGRVNVPRVDPKPKSALLYEDTSFLNLYGHLQYEPQSEDHEGNKRPFRVNIHKTSKVTPTPYATDLVDEIEKEFDFKRVTIFGQPMMMPCVRNGNYISPYNIALRKMNVNTPIIDIEVLNIVVERLTQHIITCLEARGVNELSPLLIDEAINGVQEDDFISRINTSTSAGFGHKGKKYEYMPIVREDAYVTREPVHLIKQEMVEIIECYARGEQAMPFVSVQLKDEPRELKKCEDGNTRLFYMSPLAFLILSRQYLSPFYSLMVNHCDIFCAAIGVNVHMQADEIYERMNSFSECIMEGDYGKFDLRMPLEIGQAANTIVVNVLKHFGYNEYALNIVRGILTDNLFPIIVMLGDLISRGGLQMSGKYATAEDNTLRGLVMLMYCFYMQPELKDLDFFELVLPLLYGDDVLAAVSKQIVDIFNNLTYAHWCEEYFGMEYTNAQKTKDFLPYLSINDVSFLKRHFRYDNRYNKMFWLLDLDSLCKTVSWYLPSQNVTRLEQSVGALTSVLWEIFFHVDSEEQFNRIRDKFVETICKYFYIRPSEVKLPAYDTIELALKLSH